MTTAWFQCGAGVAGDMLLGALVDAGADPVFIGNVLGGLAVDDYALSFEITQRCGVRATRALVVVHEGDHHRSWTDIRRILTSSSLPDDVRHRAITVFEHLADVEAHIHGVAIDDVEFHEVGGTDSIVDIVGVCAGLAALDIDHIVCSPIAVGHGLVDTAHGFLPNPAPAVAHLLARTTIPTIGLDDDTELATPTGVALMATLAESFGPMPAMTVSAIGYGAGARDRPGRANVVSVALGTTTSTSVDTGQPAQLFETNVDDVTGEVLAYTVTRLLAAGAHDAWTTPIIMKKGRPAFTLHVLCDPARSSDIAEIVMRETGTLGLRGRIVERWPRQRSETTVTIDGHAIRVKISAGRVKVEHDDAARAATALSVSLRSITQRVEQALADDSRSLGA